MRIAGSLRVPAKLIGLMAIFSPSAAGWAQTPPPAETAVLEADQTLEDLARQLYDDPEAAEEIRALNGLAPGAQPAPGQQLKLPGKQRQPAVAALGVAAQACQEARLHGAAEYAGERFAQAQARLQRARQACSRTDYTACQKLADEAWALARMARQETQTRRSRKNRFAVSVDKRGTTRVEVTEGDGVVVDAQKKQTVVRRNRAIRVRSGQPPEAPRPLPDPPEPVLPFPNSRLVTPSIHFRWKSARGAARYVLLISREPTGRRPVRQLTTNQTSYLFRSRLSDGDYYWFLRTVDAQGMVGRASKARRFRLAAGQGGAVTVEETAEPPETKGP